MGNRETNEKQKSKHEARTRFFGFHALRFTLNQRFGFGNWDFDIWILVLSGR